MGFFTGVEKAEIFGGGTFIQEDGDFVVEAQKVVAKENRKHEPIFIVEFKLLESTNENHPVGSSRSWLVKKNSDGGLGDIKAFVAVTEGLEPNDPRVKEVVTEEKCEELVNDDGAIKGMKFRLNTSTKPQKGDKTKNFTKHYWHVYEG